MKTQTRGGCFPFIVIGLLLASGATVGAQAGDLRVASPRPEYLADGFAPSPSTRPAPLEKVTWHSDLRSALAQAQRENRPVFVTLRCLPCKQCSAFDKSVLEGGPELDPLLKQFVAVRLISTADADRRLLPLQGFQDLDLSWWGYFLSPEGRIYGIFGGRDAVSDATRISVPALANTLRRVLEHHYDTRRPGWEERFNIDGPAAKLEGDAKGPSTYPGFDSWLSHARKETQTQVSAGCIHCHQVAEVLRQPKVDAGTFDRDRDLRMWPLPENVGLTLDRDDGLRVTKVTAKSPADEAGFVVGDVLVEAGGRRLFGQTDFRGVLHRAPIGSADIPLHWLHEGSIKEGTLHLVDGWRRTDLGWRKSVADGNIGVGPGFYPLAASASERTARGIPADSMAINPFFGKQTTAAVWQAGMRGNQIITAVGDEHSNITGRPFLVWFHLHHEPGDAVTFTVMDEKGQTRKIECKLPARGE